MKEREIRQQDLETDCILSGRMPASFPMNRVPLIFTLGSNSDAIQLRSLGASQGPVSGVKNGVTSLISFVSGPISTHSSFLQLLEHLSVTLQFVEPGLGSKG